MKLDSELSLPYFPQSDPNVFGQAIPMDFLPTIKEAKNNFLANGTISALIRPEVGQSWLRCRGRLDPQTHRPLPPSSAEVEALLTKNNLLITHGSAIIESICANIDENIYYMCLTDSEGRAIYINKGFSNKKKIIDFLRLGVCFDEESVGTNGIGLALILEKNMFIQGPEHFLNQSEAVTCATSLIRDHENTILGTITITFETSQYNDLLPGLSATAAKLIEERLGGLRYHGILKHIVDNIHESIIVIDSNLKIIQTNDQFLKLLNLEIDDLNRINASDLFKSLDIQQLLKQKNSAELGEVTIQHGSYKCKVNLHLYPVYNDHGLDCLVIFCQEISSLIIMSRKLSGKTNYYTFNDIRTKNSQMIKLIEHCRKIAELDFPILIQGPSGVGKELFAQSLHSSSQRADKPFMAVNCAALPLSLIESELFGYEKGAFTGAQNSKPGKFELADGGTIFLDEIGELPLDVQSKLLRVLDNFKVARIGGREEKRLNVRLIAATNRNLLEEVSKSNFREDLYYRLNVMSVIIPPLCDRNGDIELLSNFFLNQLNKKSSNNLIKIFTDQTMAALNAYKWPGNIREMQNSIIRAYYLCPDKFISPQYFSFIRNDNDKLLLNENQNSNNNTNSKEKSNIIDALSKCNGNVSEAACLLSIPCSSLYRKIRKYNLKAKDYI
jgi:PAS domain S-box-containing protein